MSCKHLAIICSFIIYASAKSFTLVIDTTYSMQEELNIIRTNIRPLINGLGNTSSIESFVVVPFNDPDVGPVQTFNNADSFVDSISSLTVSGGHDIPENSLSGLEKALQESRPESDVFLFTDACAKDEDKFNDIQRLCRITRSKVIVFMSGGCSYSERNIRIGSIETYNQLTKVCFGNVFHVNGTNYGQAFRFIKEVVRDGYNDVSTFESFTGYRSLSFPVDDLTKGVIVSVSGYSPVVQLFDESGHNLRTEMLIETSTSQVVRIVNPHRGLYTAAVTCVGVTSVTLYSRRHCPLEIGFSPFHPRSIEETTSSPLPGRESFIFILVPKSYDYKLSSMTIRILNNDKQRSLDLEESVTARVYIKKAYFEPGIIFKITVTGMDTATSDPIRIVSKTIEPQGEVTNTPWSAATIENIFPETSLTDYNKNATVACKVTGCPQPAIEWEDENGNKIPSEESLLMYPATYISYVQIPNLVDNTTITCKASTSSGNDSRTTQLYVYRPYVFEMIRKPEDIVIEYEAEGKIYCEVNSYPEAEVKWYHNEKEIVFTTNEADDDAFGLTKEREYFLEDNALIIRKMTSQYVGTYTCDVRNDANAVSFPVQVVISGLEPPKIELSETQLTSKIGEGVNIECRVSKGRPDPTLTWKYKPLDGYEFTNLPDDVEVQDGNIRISEVLSKHKGAYKCEAVNEQGQDAREVELRVIYAPKIENAETTTKDVLLDKSVVLECLVDAEPKATVKWERSDGVYFPDEKHVVDGNTLKFIARQNDSGTYRCVAENEAGSTEKLTNVNVLVLPYITPVVKNRNVRTGSDLTLNCHVQEADPPPTITWKFTSLDSKTTVLFKGESMFTSEHVIQRATRADSGTYRCIAENRGGWDLVEITVNVK